MRRTGTSVTWALGAHVVRGLAPVWSTDVDAPSGTPVRVFAVECFVGFLIGKPEVKRMKLHAGRMR